MERALEYRFTTQTRPSTRACLGSYGNRAKVSPARAMTNRHGHATWPWMNLRKQDGRATRPCLETMAKPIKLTQECDTPVPSNRGRTCQINTGVGLKTRAWEKRTKIDMAVCTHKPKEHGSGPNVRRAQIQNSQIIRVYHVVFTRKESHHPCFEEKEGIVIFLRSYRENSSPFPAVPHWAPRRTFPDSTGSTLGSGPLYRLGRARTTDISRTHYGTPLNVPSSNLMARFDDPGTIQFCLSGIVYQLSVPEFGTALGLYTKKFIEENELHTLNRHIHHSPSRCWNALTPERRESTGVVNTHDAYFLLCMSHRHIIDLAYFISFAIQHQMERHRKGVISIGPYVMRLARHFGLFNTAAQSSSLTLMGQMSPQGISSMLSMRISRNDVAPSLLSIVSPNPPRRRPPRTLLMMSFHVTSTHRLSHHLLLVQFMQWFHTLTSLSAFPDSSNSVFIALITLMLLYSRFVSTSISHRHPHLANHLAMKIYKELQSLLLLRNLKLHWGKFSKTAMSCWTTTIATTRYNILLA
ncbi:hypothetical protein GOBAR_AA30251 [Gossypium barbadense]|uniref:Uncharacterized protein n=1 Tax=Gossypium barbadense TaxID=3634 RepID=A0A2P5WH76_GOSBA|nr:hypothetical protein GOBAR_AA30251 [Gossypium barbadense]